MSKENAEKFMALYEQHKAIAKRLAALDAKSEEALLEGLVKLATEMGLPCLEEEIRGELRTSTAELGGVSGGVGTGWNECTFGMGWEPLCKVPGF